MNPNEIEYVISSGNVFADICLPDAEEQLTKARLSWFIRQAFDSLKLKQAELAKLLHVDQPKISALANNDVDRFSVQRLMEFVSALGYDVTIDIRKGRSRSLMRIPVIAEHQRTAPKVVTRREARKRASKRTPRPARKRAA